MVPTSSLRLSHFSTLNARSGVGVRNPVRYFFFKWVWTLDSMMERQVPPGLTGSALIIIHIRVIYVIIINERIRDRGGEPHLDRYYIFLVIDHRRGSTQLFYSCTGNRNRPLPATDPENKVCCQIASKKQDGRST